MCQGASQGEGLLECKASESVLGSDGLLLLLLLLLLQDVSCCKPWSLWLT
jgi:hypothetical protein